MLIIGLAITWNIDAYLEDERKEKMLRLKSLSSQASETSVKETLNNSK